MPKNQLFFGDNLDVLHRYLKDESIDLIYLDPPFNSRQDYNVLFKEKDGTQSASQITAFEDTWEWNPEAMHAYDQKRDPGKSAIYPWNTEVALKARSADAEPSQRCSCGYP